MNYTATQLALDWQEYVKRNEPEIDRLMKPIYEPVLQAAKEALSEIIQNRTVGE